VFQGDAADTHVYAPIPAIVCARAARNEHARGPDDLSSRGHPIRRGARRLRRQRGQLPRLRIRPRTRATTRADRRLKTRRRCRAAAANSDRSAVSTPPQHERPPARIAAGEVLYNRFCGRCHMLGRGVLPDLRRLSADQHKMFYDIVLNGALVRSHGPLDDVLSRSDAEAIHAYIVDEAWKAYAPH